MLNQIRTMWQTSKMIALARKKQGQTGFGAILPGALSIAAAFIAIAIVAKVNDGVAAGNTGLTGTGTVTGNVTRFLGQGLTTFSQNSTTLFLLLLLAVLLSILFGLFAGRGR